MTRSSRSARPTWRCFRCPPRRSRPAPDEAALQRWYDNHPDSYATPEYRRIKAIELSPQSLASEITVTDDELRAAYDEHKADYVTPEKRSAEVISAPDEAKARALADKWRGGADWAAMQAAAQAEGASGDHPGRCDRGAVSRSRPGEGGVLRAGGRGFGAGEGAARLVRGEGDEDRARVGHDVRAGEAALRDRVLAAKAADLMYDRANKLDQLLGNGTRLDDLPGDLGVVGVAGTLDAQGNTQAGAPAPIPGATELKAAIIAAAFQARQGDPPQLTEVQTPSTGGSAYYALTVESIIPPGEKPFDAVKDQVAEDWKQDQRRRFQDQAATAMMTAVQGGKSFSDAATVAGVTPKLSPLVTRNQDSPDVPPELQRVHVRPEEGRGDDGGNAGGLRRRHNWPRS